MDESSEGANRSSASECKIFNDSVHGHIEIHPLLVCIINTVQFQRLRFIKQLGLCYFVYPGASHNRFEHSIGVSYLAGKLTRILHRNQPNLGITDLDILCVEIAGLCHDMGHGPFSHLFDTKFLPQLGLKVKHEELSVKMFQYMLDMNEHLKDRFEEFKLGHDDITFIKEQIEGISESMGGKYKGRAKEKHFLYEIVANKRNGIDVDKWDYFARDCHHLGIPNPFDWQRYIWYARVITVDGSVQICTRDKQITDLYDMFHTRYALHRRAYQHKVTQILETMMADALIKANDYLLFKGKDGTSEFTMSKAIGDMGAYCKLTDGVMWQILHSSPLPHQDELKEAKHIVERIMKRDMYWYVGHTVVSPTASFNNVQKEIFDCIKKEKQKIVKIDDISVQVANFNYGMGNKDPVSRMRFYVKGDEDKTVGIGALQDEGSMFVPRTFSEKFFRVLCKKNDKEIIEVVKKAFGDWCVNNKLTKPKIGVRSEGVDTPKEKHTGVKPERTSKRRRIFE